MVIVKIWGGLGNQLFQYSFGKYLAARLRTIVKYDIQVVNSLDSFVQRELSIASFNVQIEKASDKDVKEKKCLRHIQLARMERKLAQQFPYFFTRYQVEAAIAMPAAALPIKDNCYYDGYWQSYHYPASIETVLRNEFTLQHPMQGQAADVLKIIKSSLSVSIHVRRTDYLAHPHFLTCDMGYYQKAIAYIKTTCSGARFYIFSDDISWCKKNFKGMEYEFVEGNKNFEDLVLMANCDHNIIANSTFGWWGGWLNNNPGKIVIAPADWYQEDARNINELLLPGWVSIENRATG